MSDGAATVSEILRDRPGPGDEATFESILFVDAADRLPEDRARAAPDCFHDLHLDQIVAGITAAKAEYDLVPFFHMPLRTVDAVVFRHEVLRDLERAPVFDAIAAFARAMRTVREHLAHLEERCYPRQKERWLLDAVGVYGDAVVRLAADLSRAEPRSRGLRAFLRYLAAYAAAPGFTALIAQTKEIQAALAAIRYKVGMRGPRVEVRHYAGESDYSAELREVFERFQQGAVEAYTFTFNDSPEMNHIEAQILDGVASLHPETFARLEAYYRGNRDFQDRAIVAFDREIQFYVAYLEYIARFRQAGLRFCYPAVSVSSKEFSVRDTFDLALAAKLAGTATPVTNDFRLTGPERILVVSGPNQGGKTTTARTFGQLHYLGSLGGLVPGSAARLYLPDRIFTHFEREERMTSLRGKLQDDLVRIHEILEAATPRSIVVINEIFASTTLRDALFLSRKIGQALMDRDVLGVWVTFIDEVASLGPPMVSMVSTIVPDNPAERTFKVVRRPADGLAYAMAIAEKYRLTYAMVKERIAP
jgi:DNA mismatch repair protein MutS